MQVRRIVTGHDEQGKAVFLADGPAPRAKNFQDMPGYGIAQLWATQPGSDAGRDLTLAGGSLVPGPGGTSLLFVSLPPDTVMAAPIDPQRAVAEMIENLPGLIDLFEVDDPAMHRSPAIDYGILLEGELWLELDDGEQRLLRPGDVVIQQGTRHAWRNRSQAVAKAVFFMVGAVPPAR
ncbi:MULTISPECIES: cupin domain-containing protein [Pseudomonadaceae]|uniref:Cupin domain-containing protein n=1 Tax=Phytopseudomonas seleniipraecipitans TaxID=640205 RepID=A0A1G7RR41_9GAMM|nr:MULTISPECIES: cupin domain-containing protein [Pseudomonas]UCJ14842.1 cupin domain-containing protein [Pseudomonas sp. MM211]SDG13307.1 Cupin domain-containing protein [Pseudomonas seleniipraecipitans]